MGKVIIHRDKNAAREAGVALTQREDEVQEMVFDYLQTIRVPVLGDDPAGNRALDDWAFMVPNGSMFAGTPKQRAMYMNALKRRGFKPGISDIVIAYPAAPYHGVYLELKRLNGGRTSEEQRAWCLLMERAGYYAGICSGFDVAKAFIDKYLTYVRKQA